METMENEERIQQEMAETRASLAEKLETLEQKVVGTVEGATTAVSETVDVIKDSVQETVTVVNETVKESVETVKDWFDLRAHVQEHPWMVVGGSVAAGYVLGSLSGRTSQASAVAAPADYRYATAYAQNTGHEERVSTAETKNPIKAVLSNWAPEIDKLKGLALGVLFGTAREMIASSVSEHVGEQLKDIFDSVTKKMGGEPIPSSDWANRSQELSPGESSETEAQWQGQRRYESAETPGRRW